MTSTQYSYGLITIIGLLFSAMIPQLSYADVEKYSDRPQILTIAPEKHDLGKNWEKLKLGHAEAVAELLVMYPEHELYFLARDAELLYDLAILVGQEFPAIKQRLHLINVSRANMRDPHLVEYLAENGISERELSHGRKVLFIDTGFAGTIPATIARNFPKYAKNFETHLICSSNERHPSTRAFLGHLNPAAAATSPSKMHGTIVAYEHMPRYLDRSYRYEMIEQHWEAISAKVEENRQEGIDGPVSKEKARAYMADLRAFAESEQGRGIIKKRISLWNELRQLVWNESASRKELKSKLLELLGHRKADTLIECLVRDFIETVQLHFPEQAKRLPSLKSLHLKEGSKVYGNKLRLGEKHPEWKPILEDPSQGVEALIQAHEFHILRSILDVIEDAEFVGVSYQLLDQYYSQYSEKHLHLGSLKEIRLTLSASLKNSANISHIYLIENSQLLKDAEVTSYLAGPIVSVAQKLESETFDYEHSDPILVSALKAIARTETREKQYLDALLIILEKHPDSAVKAKATKALGSLGVKSDRFYEVLVHEIVNGNEIHDKHVSSALVALREGCSSETFQRLGLKETLMRFVADPNANDFTQSEAMDILAAHSNRESPDPQLLDLFLNLLKTSVNEYVRLSAVMSLRATDERSKDALLAAAFKDPSDLVRRNALGILGDSVPLQPELLNPIFNAYRKDQNEYVRLEAAKPLLKYSHLFLEGAVLTLIRDALRKDPSYSIRLELAKTIESRSHLGDSETLEILLDLSKNDPNDYVAAVAAGRLVTLNALDSLVCKRMLLQIFPKGSAYVGVTQAYEVLTQFYSAHPEKIQLLKFYHDQKRPLYPQEFLQLALEFEFELPGLSINSLTYALYQGDIEATRELLDEGANPFHLIEVLAPDFKTGTLATTYFSMVQIVRLSRRPEMRSQLKDLLLHSEKLGPGEKLEPPSRKRERG